MAKKLKIFVLVFAVALSLGLLAACAPNEYTLKYAAGEGGGVTGETEQVVKEDEDGSTVTAVADFGYKFVKWSDGVTTAERTDREVSGDITVTAEFIIEHQIVMSHLVQQGVDKSIGLSPASENETEDIFIGFTGYDTALSNRNRETFLMASQLAQIVFSMNFLEFDTAYDLRSGYANACKLQAKFNEQERTYRFFISPSHGGFLAIVDAKYSVGFELKEVDFLLFENIEITDNKTNSFELENIRLNSTFRLDFQEMRYYQINAGCGDSAFRNYMLKYSDDIKDFFDADYTIFQLPLWTSTPMFGSCNIQINDGYRVSVKFKGDAYLISDDIHISVTLDIPTITCVPDEGYRFVMWSDGVTSPTRTDVKPTDGNTLTLYAIVEKIN